VAFVNRVEGDTKTWLLQNAVCNVVPSRYSEAFGLTVLESFAAGRPVIATDVPGLCELVDDGHNGVLVAPESVEGLAAALRGALERPAWFDELSRGAREGAQGLTWDRAVERYLALYEELVGCA
jgi:phosphatidylinositol alpha-mannosyltransferase